MEWTQFIIFFIGVFGLWIWNRAESRADARHMENMIRANRDVIDAIREDIKDFHGRLCSIEERNKK
jgi:hypothetical protein